MEQLPEQVYTNEYRRQAVLLVTRDKMSVAEVSRKLSMSQKTLANWVSLSAFNFTCIDQETVCSDAIYEIASSRGRRADSAFYCARFA